MGKIGRNDPCFCGSGKKYKKCCLGKEDPFLTNHRMVHSFFQHLSYEEVNAMSTGEIIRKLSDMGIPFKQEEFIKETVNSYSAEEISERWFEKYSVHAKGRDADFPWFAAWILWKRLAPPTHLSMEQMNELYVRGFQYVEANDSISACDTWLEFWEALKVKNNPKVNNLDFLDKQYKGTFILSNFCQELELELHNAGLRDVRYYKKRIEYCREFCDLFPEESELTMHNMRRAIADSYGRLGEYKKAEEKFKEMEQDFPNNPWIYVGWGDLYVRGPKRDVHKAQKIYENGIAIAKGHRDVDALLERLEDVKQEM